MTDAVRRARISAASLVGTLIAIGLTVSLSADSGSIWRDLGLAVLSGGIVGGALVTVESLLTGAADRRAEAASLRLMLTTTMDLSGIDIADAQLSDVYLPGRALVAAHLAGANLDGAKLQFADLRHANLVGASLRGADLRGATLAHSDLRDSNFEGALLDDADLSHALLDNANLSAASLLDTRLEQTRFGRARVTGTAIGNAYLHGAQLADVDGPLDLARPVEYDGSTTFPSGFEPPRSVSVTQAPIARMDLADYLAYRRSIDT